MNSEASAVWYLSGKLQTDFVDDWIAAGPQLLPHAPSAADRDAGPGITGAPCERARFTAADPAGTPVQFTWRVLHCAEDHLVDLTAAIPASRPQCAWAYTELVAPAAQTVDLVLDTFGPARVWVDDRPVLAAAGPTSPHPVQVAAAVTLAAGPNRVLVRLDQPDGSSPLGFRLRVAGSAARLKVRVPTLNRDVKLHESVARLARRAYLDADLVAGSEVLYVKWPRTIQTNRKLMVRVQKPSGGIVGEVEPEVGAGLVQRVLEAGWVKDGRYQVKVLPPYNAFVQGLRVGYDLDVNLLHADFAAVPEGDLNARAVELLKHTAYWTEGIFAQLAAMALGQWQQVNGKEILRLLDAVRTGEQTDYMTLLGLLLMAYRYRGAPGFPPDLTPALEQALLHFAPGEAAPKDRGLAGDTAVVAHACRVLLGQLYPTRRLAWDGQLGRDLQAAGEAHTQLWLARRAQGGFAAWDSGEGFAAMVLGLVALVDHAASGWLAELAAATVDKILLSLALNSCRGVFGSTHGATAASSVTDARMEPTSPISRLLWGVGCWNPHMAAGYALATSTKYGAPPLFAQIALDDAGEQWSQERHVTAWQGGELLPEPAEVVHKVTYRTPDTLLASAVDYRPGAPGGTEHVWQATLGPGAVVFVNHPRTLNQHDAYPANFWRGNGVLPRVAQHRDLLVALYHLPEDDWLGFTHAHFPLAAFDEQVVRRGWAFGRKGDGYVALTAATGMELVKQGPGAYRELRAPGRDQVWICLVGRAAQDGSFAAFQRAVLQMPVTYADDGVTLVTRRGETVRFGRTGPFTVDGVAQPLAGFPHYATPYCVCPVGATRLDIRYADATLQLDLTPVTA